MAKNDKPETNIFSLFPTPVIASPVPDAEALNKKLTAVIEARMAVQPSNDHSNFGGWQSSWDMADWGGAAAAQLLQHVRSVADTMTCDRQGQSMDLNWRMNAWANVNGPGDGNEYHTHPGCFWSGTYYVDDGGIAEDGELGGQFEALDPRGVAPAMYAPRLAIRAPGGLGLGSSEMVSPKAGLMLLFPAWLMHQVRPYRGTRRRISIAFNLSI